MAAEFGDSLLAVFHSPFHCGVRDYRVGVTIGYVLAPHNGTQIAALLKAADAAMYAGKQRGKGLVTRA
jgi:GGDEF domain-containing protein